MADCEKRDLTEDLKKLPGWFQPVPGFKFRDPDGDEVIVIGEGGWRKAEVGRRAYELVFKPWTLLGCYNYKGEWHMFDLLDQTPGWWNGCKGAI